MMRVTKDPQAVLDYGLDWSQWLIGSDTITTSTWTLSGTDSALVIDSDFTDLAVTGVWLSGGTDGGDYRVTNHIVTAAGREDDRTIQVSCKQR